MNCGNEDGGTPLFPVSPGEAYAAISSQVDLERHYGRRAAMELTDTLTEVVAEQIWKIRSDATRGLAVPRAAVTCGVELRGSDDSCGALGGWFAQTVAAYCRTPSDTRENSPSSRRLLRFWGMSRDLRARGRRTDRPWSSCGSLVFAHA